MIEKGVWKHKESGRYFEVIGMAKGPYGAEEVVIYKPVGYHKQMSWASPAQFMDECESLDNKLKKIPRKAMPWK